MGNFFILNNKKLAIKVTKSSFNAFKKLHVNEVVDYACTTMTMRTWMAIFEGLLLTLNEQSASTYPIATFLTFENLRFFLRLKFCVSAVVDYGVESKLYNRITEPR